MSYLCTVDERTAGYCLTKVDCFHIHYTVRIGLPPSVEKISSCVAYRTSNLGRRRYVYGFSLCLNNDIAVE